MLFSYPKFLLVLNLIWQGPAGLFLFFMQIKSKKNVCYSVSAGIYILCMFHISRFVFFLVKQNLLPLIPFSLHFFSWYILQTNMVVIERIVSEFLLFLQQSQRILHLLRSCCSACKSLHIAHTEQPGA